MTQPLPPVALSAGTTAIHRRVAALRAHTDPTLIGRLASGWAVFGERQFLRGYALLLPDPVVPTLNALQVAARLQLLDDAAALGDALLEATGALRINYAVFGNLEPALHVHVVPRYLDEPGPLRTAHPWSYDWDAAPAFDAERDAPLREALRAILGREGRLAEHGVAQLRE
jgi:diadenosine tetraphosphate (Ap4A) HIT family hydrolase